MDYHALDAESVLQFASPYLDGEPERADEIGDGNLNLVFKVYDATGKSVVVKQALPYLRLAGEGWPLSKDRARIEAGALEVHWNLAPGRVPRLLHYEDDLRAIVMENLEGYPTLRNGMIAGNEYPDAFRHIGEFAARTLLGTSDLLMDSTERKALTVRFSNPELCALTEDFVFTSPFMDSPSNDISPDLRPYAEQLWRDRAVVREAARLRFEFRTRAEALVHGDLHTGSVMVTATDTRIIDPEFAYYGPMAFDTGKFLGNLAMSYISHRAQGSAYAPRVARAAHEFWDTFVETASTLWRATEPWRGAFLRQLLDDSARYAAASMLRRTIGIAHVADIHGISVDGQRLRAQVEALRGGRALLLSRGIGSLEDLWGIATQDPEYGPPEFTMAYLV